MKREITMSLTLHLVLITVALMSAPLSMNKPFDYGEAIKIRAVSFPEFEQPEAVLEPISIPQPALDDAIDILV